MSATLSGQGDGALLLTLNTVVNVANFGNFADIGVHQDGLAHKSALSEKIVKDLGEAVKAVKGKVAGGRYEASAYCAHYVHEGCAGAVQ